MQFQWAFAIETNLKILKIVSLWPENGPNLTLYSMYTAFTVVAMGLLFILQVKQLFHIDNFPEMTGFFFFLTSTFLCCLKIGVFLRHFLDMKLLLKTLESARFQPKTAKQTAAVKTDLSLWGLYFKVFFGSACVTGFGCMLLPILSGRYKTGMLPLPFWPPIDPGNPANYAILYAFSCFCIFILLAAVSNVDLFLAAMVVFIGAQCDVLADTLETLHSEPLLFQRLLIQSIVHYQELLEFSRTFNGVWEVFYLFQFFLTMVNIATNLFQMTTAVDDFAVYTSFGIVICLNTQLFSYCFFGERVLTKSDHISFSLFKSAWISQSEFSKKLLLIFMIKSQNCISISVFSLFKLSFDILIKILKSTWSCLMLLKQFDNTV